MISYRKLAMRVLGHSPVSAVKTARRSTGKRAAALALTAALVVGMTLPAFADVYDLTKGDISVGFKNNQQTVTQEDGKGGYVKNKNNEDIIDLPDNDVVITTKDAETSEVKTTDNTVTVNSNEGKTVNVTLDNVNIDTRTRKTSEAAVSVTGSGNTNIELNGNNTLTSGGRQAGLEHNKKDSNGKETSGTLTITDTDKNGSLTANGSSGGAGIGGANFKDAGKLEITGGTINATGSNGGAGIGGGDQGGDADIVISGGTITAAGGSDPRPGAVGGAGIGGGGWGGNATITITGDAVIKEATGGQGCAGIGSSLQGKVSVIIEGNSTIGKATGGAYAAGIGGGRQGTGDVTIKDNAQINESVGGNGGAGIGSGVYGDVTVSIEGNATVDKATGGEEGAGIGGGAGGLGNVSIEGNVTIKNAKGGAGAAGIGGGAETQPDTEDTRNKVSIKSTEAGSPNITATGGGVLNDEKYPLAGAAAIGSGSVAHDATEVKSDITVEGKVTIDATGGGDVAIGDSINGETQFSGLQVATTITRRNANGDDVSQPGDVVREPEKPEPEKPEPEKPAQPTVTPTEGAEAPSTGSVEVERPVTVEGLSVTNVLGKQITHTCTQNGTTLTIRANGIVTSAHLTLGMVRTLKAQGVKTLVFTTLLSRSTTVSVDALLAAEPDAPDEAAVVWTHTGPRAALTIDGADHSALLK
ncbi:hypothetical protein CGS58_00760 [Faecalibacterium prausnitzii]|uniref:Carbohydrate-binding domain-containing protein n=1 Tax=Faecalibacterium prausnitzii TaxID=853 RepID=A0A2A7ASI5_9FIRM|nr:hypothetical protein CGS58_00760 [Faecalibacterium prausnitzii]